MFETIVWATDGSTLADRALEHVKELARIHDSKIVAVHANQLLTGRLGGTPVLANESDIREKVTRQVAEMRDNGIDVQLEVLTGHDETAKLIAKAAEEADANLIVVGTQGRNAIVSAFIGSVARELCHASRVPVLVVPPAGRIGPPGAKTEQLTTA